MRPTSVAVGSTNPVKIDAVRMVLKVNGKRQMATTIVAEKRALWNHPEKLNNNGQLPHEVTSITVQVEPMPGWYRLEPEGGLSPL